jgi:hypothetical protein
MESSFSDYAEHASYNFRHDGMDDLRNNGHHHATGCHQSWQGNQDPSGG